MAVEVPMPVVTEAGEEAVVTAWMVDEGASVREGALIAEVQAEKVADQVYAPADGIVRGLVAINQPVAQGSPICRIDESGEVRASGETSGPSPAPPRERVAASPAARRLARELGVDLAAVPGSGPAGRVTEADVRAAAGTEEPGEAFGALRATIARNMRESHTITAPVTLTTTADVTDALPDNVTARVVRAVARVLQDHPALNGTRSGDRFLPAGPANVALAMQTEDGLVAPVIRDPAARTIDELATDIADIAERARTRRLSAADFEGGTFSVSNLGPYGVEAFTPIVNLPQVAILGVGTIRTVPGFGPDGSVVPRREMVLSLTFDHAFVDGAPAAALLSDLRDLLEEGA